MNMNPQNSNLLENLNIWLLIDDRAGNKSQILGVAKAFGGAYEIKDIVYNAVAALPNRVLGATFKTISSDTKKALTPPWPDLVISAGRRTAPIARKIKNLSASKSKLVQIMYPGPEGDDAFTLIAVPSHDQLSKAQNRMEITGAPHAITAKTLQTAQTIWADKFSHLPRPYIALIVGGSTKRKTFTSEMATELGAQAARLAKISGGSLLITTSRRSTDDATKALLQAVRDTPVNIFKWGDEGDNPYFGYLSLADHVIVTGDSVSMCSEACATPKPVYIYAPKDLIGRKHAHLHADLYAKGYAEPLRDDTTLSDWTHPPLNPAVDIAKEIKRRLKL